MFFKKFPIFTLLYFKIWGKIYNKIKCLKKTMMEKRNKKNKNKKGVKYKVGSCDFYVYRIGLYFHKISSKVIWSSGVLDTSIGKSFATCTKKPACPITSPHVYPLAKSTTTTYV
jgi:hypothetical protein